MRAPRIPGDWYSIGTDTPIEYRCGYCDTVVGSRAGYYHHQHPQVFRIRICPNCNRPTFFEDKVQTPGVAFGEYVGNLPEQVAELYQEARRCTSIGASTAAVLCCRKILMHIAIDKGAEPGRKFIEYVNHLVEAGYVPPDGRGWVDHIRATGNEANHEIKIMSPDTASELVVFVEMLLRFIYDLPSRVPKPRPKG
jgi:hypothetical protein